MLWEYCVVAIEGTAGDIQTALNKYGQQRWELVAVEPGGDYVRCYLKRFGTFDSGRG